MKAALPLLVFALGCATRSANLETTGNLETNVPACIDGTVADVIADSVVLADARFEDALRRFLVDARYGEMRLVDVPDAAPTVPRNVDDVQRALIRLYPVNLRNAGIGGVATALLLVDTIGVVIHRRILTSSGYAGLDGATEEVVDIMRFSPVIVDGCRASFVALMPVGFMSSARPPR